MLAVRFPQQLSMWRHARQAAPKLRTTTPTTPSLRPPRRASRPALRTPFHFLFDIMTSMLSWLFRTKDVPQLYYAPIVASVTTRRSLDPTEGVEEPQQVSLQDLVEKRCPSLHNTFTPSWWLPK